MIFKYAYVSFDSSQLESSFTLWDAHFLKQKCLFIVRDAWKKFRPIASENIKLTGAV